MNENLATRSVKVAVALLLAGVAALGVRRLSRFGYETAPYETQIKDGPFEIRSYPEIMLVSTPMRSREPGDENSFRRLFRYISGGNERREKIAMTTPVFSTLDQPGGRMSFVVPHAVAERGPPRATDEQVDVDTLPAGRFAVYRFSGRWTPVHLERARARLVDWMADWEMAPADEPHFAGYDPPFTPPPLRRNEVLVRIYWSPVLQWEALVRIPGLARRLRSPWMGAGSGSTPGSPSAASRCR